MKNEPSSYETARKIRWLEAVIHHAVANARRKYRRWEREAALSLTFVDEETGEEIAATIPDPAAQLDYEAVELRIWLQVLPDIEQVILEDLYVYDLSQRGRHNCCISAKCRSVVCIDMLWRPCGENFHKLHVSKSQVEGLYK